MHTTPYDAEIAELEAGLSSLRTGRDAACLRFLRGKAEGYREALEQGQGGLCRRQDALPSLCSEGGES